MIRVQGCRGITHVHYSDPAVLALPSWPQHTGCYPDMHVRISACSFTKIIALQCCVVFSRGKCNIFFAAVGFEMQRFEKLNVAHHKIGLRDEASENTHYCNLFPEVHRLMIKMLANNRTSSSRCNDCFIRPLMYWLAPTSVSNWYLQVFRNRILRTTFQN